MSATHVSTESKQDYATPPELVALIEKQFGVEFLLDLAAGSENTKAPNFLSVFEDSLSLNWKASLEECDNDDIFPNRAAWLNPPFKRAEPWMAKCAEESAKGIKIVSLTLSSLGSNWYRDNVEGKALSFVLRDRVTFVGCDQPYTKELMVSLWGSGMSGLSFWSWKK